jgi:hypothetical protein
LQDVKKGDLLLLDERISSFSSDPNPPIELYSSIKDQYYPSTIIIIEDGFALDNQFSIGTCPLHVSHRFARNSFAVPNVRKLRDAELQVCPDDEFVVRAAQRNALWRQRFVERDRRIQPEWSVMKHKQDWDSGVAVVPFISTSIDPTSRIQVFFFRKDGDKDGDEEFKYTAVPWVSSTYGKWWTISIPVGSRHEAPRRVSHIVCQPGDEEVIVHFHSTEKQVVESSMYDFKFKANTVSKQHPDEIHTVRDTMVLKWLINLNKAPAYMLRHLPHIGTKIPEKIICNRPFRDLDDFQAKIGWFPRPEDRKKEGTGFGNRRDIRRRVTFGSVDTESQDSPPHHDRDVKFTPRTPKTVRKPLSIQVDTKTASYVVLGSDGVQLLEAVLEDIKMPDGRITLDRVLAAAGERIAWGKGGLNVEHMRAVLNKFEVDTDGDRFNLTEKLRRLLVFLEIDFTLVEGGRLDFGSEVYE